MKMLIPAILLLSTSAMAADLKWDVEGRFDYSNSTVKHESVTPASNYEEKRSEFNSNILRLNAVTTINENLSARFRYRFSTLLATANRDLSFSNLDFFYVDHKSEFFTARLGKSAQSDSLGREFYVAGTDYPTTMSAATDNAAGTPAGYISSNSAVYNALKADADLYHVGATLMFNQVPNSTISIAAFNPSKTALGANTVDTAGANNNATNSKMGLGFYYNGSFMEKMLQPTVGYTMLSNPAEANAATPGNNTASGTHKLTSVGVRSEMQGFVLDLDWKQYKRANTAKLTDPSSEDKYTSIWANVAYTWDNLTPFVNYINDKYTASAVPTSAYKRTAFTGGLLIKPMKDVNFSYHVEYTNDVKKLDAATAATADKKVTANQISAGIKFDI